MAPDFTLTYFIVSLLVMSLTVALFAAKDPEGAKDREGDSA